MLKSPEIIRNVQLKHGGLAPHLVGDVTKGSSCLLSEEVSFFLKTKK